MGEAMRPAKLHAWKRGKLLFAYIIRPFANYRSAAARSALTLITEGFDRMLIGRLVGRIETEDQPDGGGESHREQHHAQ